MRKLLLGAAALAAIATPLALAGSANAAVAVNNGVGHVDKGDIQSSSVLDMSNGTFQTEAKAGRITFTANVDRVIADYEMTCGPSATGVTMHRVITQPARMVVEATPVLNGNGSQTLGYDLTGKTGKVISVGQATMADSPCPEGSFPWMNVGTPRQYVKGITGGLQVNGVDLPNTPVDAPIT